MLAFIVMAASLACISSGGRPDIFHCPVSAAGQRIPPGRRRCCALLRVLDSRNSASLRQVDGKKVRGRRYPWGVVQIESMEHSDFIPLRNMLVSRTDCRFRPSVSASVLDVTEHESNGGVSLDLEISEDCVRVN